MTQRQRLAVHRRPRPERPTFVLKIRSTHNTDGAHIRGLRTLLKRLLRRYGFVCIDARQETDIADGEARP